MLFTVFLLFGVGGKGAFAQNRLTGKVTDSLGNAIERATVHVKSTNAKTATDVRGFFEIAATSDAVLIVTALGYQRQEVSVMGQGSVAIILQPAANELEEVEINAGYYTTTRRTSTGNIARVTSETVEKQPVLNVLEALKSQMAGVDIQQSSGDVGRNLTVRIRGQNSLRNDANDPLFLIDGVPFPTASNRLLPGAPLNSPLNTLNPNDILSVEVLKDADATAIYGSRGSNGVILITTKKGQAGDTRLMLAGNVGVGRIRKFTELLNTAQYLEMRREAYANAGESIMGDYSRDLLAYDETSSTDWQRSLLGGDAMSRGAQASLTGGQGDLAYLLSGNYQAQGNIFPGDFGYRRGGGRMSLTKLGSNGPFRAQIDITYTLDENTMPNVSASLVAAAITLAPNAPSPFGPDGLLNWENGIFTENPMANVLKPYRQMTGNSVVNGTLGYDFSERFRFRVALGYNALRSAEEREEPARSFSAENAQGAMFNASSISTNWNVEPVLEWNGRLFQGDLQLLAGGTVTMMDVAGEALAATGFANEVFMRDRSLAARLTATTRQGQYRYLAGYGRMNYAYRNRYILNLTGRRDGSSRFGPGRGWGNFGAIGAAWVFGDEPMVKHLAPWISFGKLRGSFGVTGSDQIADYGYMATYSVSNGIAYPLVASPLRIANADYRWESNRKLEFALELAFLRDNAQLNLAWYRNRSGSQLVGYPLPASSGFPSVQYNLPATVQNGGLELEALATILERKDLKWTMGANLTLPERRLLAYQGIGASSYATTYRVGKSMDIAFQYHYEGVDPETGIYRFTDLDGDGRITDADRIWRVKPRTVFGGLQNQFRFRDVELSAYLQVDRRERTFYRSFSPPGLSMGNQPVEVLDRWRSAGDRAAYQLFWSGGGEPYTAASYMSGFSDAWAEDTFFARLTNVTLGWSCPVDWYGRWGLKGLVFSVSGQNLWVSDKKNRFDPETAYNTMPLLRTFSGRLQITL